MSIKNYRCFEIAIWIVFIWALPKTASPQISSFISEFPGETKHLSKKSGVLTVVKNVDGKYRVNEVIDLNEDKNIIVEFKSKPLCLENRKNALYKSIHTDVHEDFKNQLRNFVNSPNTLQKSAVYSGEYEITHEYYKVFNGLAMKCKRGLVSTIKNMPMVKQVYDEITYKTTLMNSVAQINADRVHRDLGITGKNVVIGILDTGIDYMHPALGGGIGAGYKVIGGYDFVNDDNDPMDDEGHGTHIAGIVAAKSDSISGVAPEATLLAVKVLNSEGSGLTSDIIDGIEYCYDPDNNPNTDDGVDIINMSLGGFTQAPNPLDSVVNNISEAGILSVVGAGNDGEPASISSPGTAKEALTVGACDSSFELAYFSSRGPDPIHDYLKPEVIAPGVDIYSTILNGNFEQHSGTSMAAPHVAGVAALIKEKYPEMSASDLKSLIVNNAHHINNQDVYNVGNGCVDALKAIEDSLIINPGTISFGFADCRLSEWRDTTFIVIKNKFSFGQHINLNISSISNNLISLNFSEHNFYLEPLEERKITIEIIVPGSVPVKDVAPFTYSGKILCSSNTDSTIIPFGFTKASRLEIHFDKEPVLVYATNKSTEEIFDWHDFNENLLKAKLPTGDYSFIFIMSESDLSQIYAVTNENITVSGYNESSISFNDAKYKVQKDIYDFTDHLLALTDENSCFFNNISYKNTFGISIDIDFISELDTNWIYSRKFIYDFDDSFIGITHEINGIDDQSDLQMPSGSENLVPYHVKFDFPNKTEFQENSGGIYLYSSSGSISWQFKGDPYYHKIYLNKNNTDDENYEDQFVQFRTKQVKDTTINSMESGPSDFYYFGPKMRIDNNGKMETFDILYNSLDAPRKRNNRVLVRYNYWPDDTLAISPESEVKYPMQSRIKRKETISNYPVLEYAGFYNISTPNGVCQNPFDQTCFMRYFLYSNIGRFNDNQVLKDLGNGLTFYAPYTFFPDLDQNFEMGQYIYDKPCKISGFSPVYQICNQKGISITENAFTYDSEDINDQVIDIPVLQLFQIISAGQIVTRVTPGQSNFVQFQLYDDENNIDQIRTRLICNNGEERTLYTEKVLGTECYKAEIPSDLPDEFIDVMITATDSMKSTTTFLASPGFYYGNPEKISYESRIHLINYDMINDETFQFNDFNIGDTLKFQLNYVNIGNVAARDIYWDFPPNYFFDPVNNKIELTGNLEPGDSCLINLDLVTINNANDTTFVYSPKVTWKINGKKFSRSHSVFSTSIKTYYPPDPIEIPEEYRLYHNFPNPFNANTTIRFQLVADDNVKISIYNIRGQLIKTLTNRMFAKGYHSICWDGTDNQGNQASSGIYFYRMNTDSGFNKSVKMILLK